MYRASRAAMAAVVFLSTGHLGDGATAAEPKPLATTSGRVELQFPADWAQDRESPFDLQASSKGDRMTTGVFEFFRADLSAETTPHDVLEMQVGDLRSKRKNFVRVEEEKIVQEGKRRITTVLYAGERGASRYHYRFTLVEFASPELFLVVLQVAVPSEWSRSVPIFDAINRSATLLPAPPR